MAKSAPYFPFYPDDWLDDESIFDMGLECEGAYIRLLAAMWKRGGSLNNDQYLICNILRCKPAKWKKIQDILTGYGVIYLSDDRFFNARLTKELRFFNEKSQKNVENANKRWSNQVENVGKKVNEINETSNAVAMQSQCHTDTDSDTDLKEKIKENAPSFKLPQEVDPELWKMFESHRKHIKKPMSDSARVLQSNILKKISIDDQRKLIEYSISGNYPALYVNQLGNNNGNKYQDKNQRTTNRNLELIRQGLSERSIGDSVHEDGSSLRIGVVK